MSSIFSFVDKMFRGPETSATEPALGYILGLRYTVRTRAGRNEIAALEDAIRRCPGGDMVLDNVEPGNNELAFWLHVASPKRAFKTLTELPELAPHMSILQAAYAERSKMKFSILWPKGSAAYVPPRLG